MDGFMRGLSLALMLTCALVGSAIESGNGAARADVAPSRLASGGAGARSPEALVAQSHAGQQYDFTPATSAPTPLSQGAGDAPASAPASPLRTQVYGFLPYWNLSTYQDLRYQLLSTIAYFSVDPNNSTGAILTNTNGYQGWTSQQASQMISMAHSNGVRVDLTVSDFDTAGISQLLASNSSRQTLITALVAMIKGHADGVNVDFESYSQSSTDRANFVSFMSQLTSAMHQAIPGSQVTVDTYAVSATEITFFDIPSLGAVVDDIFVMGYDYHWSGSSSTGAVAPINGGRYNVYQTLMDYTNVTSASKIILGEPYYGYDWPSASNGPNAPTTGDGSSVPYQQVLQSASYQSSALQWDAEAQSPWYAYQTGGAWHEVYFENAQSMAAKDDLVNGFHLAGAGVWALGDDDGYSDLWNVIDAKLTGHDAFDFATIVGPSSTTSYTATQIGGTAFNPEWTLTNGGTTTWGAGYQLRLVSGSAMVEGTSIPIAATAPGQTATVNQWFAAPLQPGTYTGQWQMQNAAGGLFGPLLTITITVAAAAPNTTTYWFPWYDATGAYGIQGDWLLMANPNVTQTVAAQITVNGVTYGPYLLAPGQRVTPQFSGVRGGPVRIMASGRLIITQRTLVNGSFNEEYATPNTALTTDYWYTWYDRKDPYVQGDWLLIANPTEAVVSYAVSIHGQQVATGTLNPGQEVTPQFGGVIGGPVHIEASGNVLTSQRTLINNSFCEVLGTPDALLDPNTYLPWYDLRHPSNNGDWVLVANPISGQTASFHIYIGAKDEGMYSLAPGQEVEQQFAGVMGGPIHVAGDMPLLVSQRTLYAGSFHEVMGQGQASMLTDVWYPWYDSLSTYVQGDWVLVANTSSQPAQVGVSVAGVTLVTTTLAAGQEITPAFPHLQNGPVHVWSDQPIVSSQREIMNGSFSELMGQGVNTPAAGAMAGPALPPPSSARQASQGVSHMLSD